jgi:hypothetical protein
MSASINQKTPSFEIIFIVVMLSVDTILKSRDTTTELILRDTTQNLVEAGNKFNRLQKN